MQSDFACWKLIAQYWGTVGTAGQLYEKQGHVGPTGPKARIRRFAADIRSQLAGRAWDPVGPDIGSETLNSCLGSRLSHKSRQKPAQIGQIHSVWRLELGNLRAEYLSKYCFDAM